MCTPSRRVSLVGRVSCKHTYVLVPGDQDFVREHYISPGLQRFRLPQQSHLRKNTGCHQGAAEPAHTPSRANLSCANLSFPALTQAKLGDEMLDYKDLAALPKTKAIYNIDRPDLLSYSPYVSYPSEERHHAEVS